MGSIKALVKLGHIFSDLSDSFINNKKNVSCEVLPFFEAYRKLIHTNPFFDAKNLSLALSNWSSLLTEANLTAWLKTYNLPYQQAQTSKTVALIMAANIPLVGLHDILSVLISGHNALIRKTKTDENLYFPMRSFLQKQDEFFDKKIIFTEGKLEKFDAVIATGGNNTYRYFDYYFSKYPSILRHHRNSVAVLSGEENESQLTALGCDIMDYYGMGCRSVSKIFIPEGFAIQRVLQALPEKQRFVNCEKYMNNYTYQKACYMIDQADFLDNGYLIIKESKGFHSPLGVLYYEYYRDIALLEKQLTESRENLQCVYSDFLHTNPGITFSKIGSAQKPVLDDYADGKDTLDFLQKL